MIRLCEIHKNSSTFAPDMLVFIVAIRSNWD